MSKLTLPEFKAKYLGKQVEFHSYGTGAQNQCVDLANAYISEVLGLTPIIGTNACDFATKYNPKEFTFIKNTPTGIPIAGDLPVWSSKVGSGAGHIAIAEEGSTTSILKSLDQNWSKIERVTEEKHNYTNVLGWLRPINLNTDTTMNPNKKLPVEFYKIDESKVLLKRGRILDTDAFQEIMAKFIKVDDELEEQIKHFDTEVASIRAKNTEDTNKLKLEHADNIKKLDNKIIELNTEIERLSKEPTPGKDANQELLRLAFFGAVSYLTTEVGVTNLLALFGTHIDAQVKILLSTFILGMFRWVDKYLHEKSKSEDLTLKGLTPVSIVKAVKDSI